MQKDEVNEKYCKFKKLLCAFITAIQGPPLKMQVYIFFMTV